MIQNNVEEHFNYANEKAGELALKAKEISKKKCFNCRKSASSK
jgi:hypothetical protein